MADQTIRPGFGFTSAPLLLKDVGGGNVAPAVVVTDTAGLVGNPGRVVSTSFQPSGAAQAIWTPLGGKRVRLIGYRISFAGDLTQSAAGFFSLSVVNSTGTWPTFVGASAYVPSAALNGISLVDSGFIPLGSFYTNAIGDVIQVQSNNPATGGRVYVAFFGDEV